ncbi:MAG: hypothetical protein Q8R90_11525 [Bacteroidales bacterium]|nr:hypothetical protein [Bacteroidales bacterium]
MKRSEKYAGIGSLSKLREERYKLQSEITNRELMIGLHYSQLKESLSITRFLTTLITKISVIMPLFQMAKNLYRLVIEIFSKEEKEVEKEVSNETEEGRAGEKEEERAGEKENRRAGETDEGRAE